jgi:peptidoglycan/xylan/chitin deacetylase (PgdA/CDA1 family)
MQKNIYLTFDDGPSAKTLEIAKLLNSQGVHATFFMSGNNVLKFKDVPKQVLELGHSIGLHGMHHVNPNSMSATGVSREIRQSKRLLEGLTGQPITLYRAPFGILTKPLIKILKREGLAHVDWDKDTFDWKKAVAGESLDVEKLLRMASNGSVMLFHDGAAEARHKNSEERRGSNLLQILPRFIEELKRRGYEFRPITKRIDFHQSWTYFGRSIGNTSEQDLEN